jgi:hypothetical protein
MVKDAKKIAEIRTGGESPRYIEAADPDPLQTICQGLDEDCRNEREPEADASCLPRPKQHSGDWTGELCVRSHMALAGEK